MMNDSKSQLSSFYIDDSDDDHEFPKEFSDDSVEDVAKTDASRSIEFVATLL